MMKTQTLICLLMAILVCFITESKANPIESDETKHWGHGGHGGCLTHRDCGCLGGIPVCHNHDCVCLHGGLFAETSNGVLIETQAPDTVTETTETSMN